MSMPVAALMLALAPAQVKEAEAIMRTINCGDSFSVVKRKTKRLGKPDFNGGEHAGDSRTVSWYFGTCPDGVLASPGCKGEASVYFSEGEVAGVVVVRMRQDSWGERSHYLTVQMECPVKK